MDTVRKPAEPRPSKRVSDQTYASRAPRHPQANVVSVRPSRAYPEADHVAGLARGVVPKTTGRFAPHPPNLGRLVGADFRTLKHRPGSDRQVVQTQRLRRVSDS